MAHNFLMLPLAGKSKVSFHTGWYCVFFRIFSPARWPKTITHDCWLGSLFPEKVLLASREERLSFFQEY